MKNYFSCDTNFPWVQVWLRNQKIMYLGLNICLGILLIKTYMTVEILCQIDTTINAFIEECGTNHVNRSPV